MAKLKFNNGVVKDFTFILSTRDYRHIGKLTGIRNVSYRKNENDAHTLSFTIDKYDFIKNVSSNYDLKLQLKMKQSIWNQIVDFKLIYVKELKEYFELRVNLTDSTTVSKSIQCNSLCESELSQLRVSLEINTDSDIDKNGKATMICDFNNPNFSAIHRILKEKAPHYTVGYVSKSLIENHDIRRFTIKDQPICDLLRGEFSEQYHCIVKFDSSKRKVNIYDLFSTCDDCGHYGDFYGKCPKCESTKLINDYGKDTSIYVDKNNLTDSIQLQINADNIKNCFKLEAGDDKVNDAIRLVNPNGSNYIYRITEYQRNDMPKSLCNKLDTYNELYNNVLEKSLDNVDEIKNNELFQNLTSMNYPVNKTIDLEHDVYAYSGITYEQLTNEIDNANEKYHYYKTTMMPDVNSQNGINATTEANKLSSTSLSPLGMSKLTINTYKSTVNNALLNYAKLHILSSYVKLEIIDDNYTYQGESGNVNKGLWTGRFKLTNYSDKDDVVCTDLLTIEINDYEDVVTNQKILKTLNVDDKKYTIYDALAIEDLNDFSDAINLYSFDELNNFYNSLTVTLDTLELLKQQNEIGENAYNELSGKYKSKRTMVEDEKNQRESSYRAWEEIYLTYINLRTEIQTILNFENYLGDEYKIFCMYRREDVYSNANYISDNLDSVRINECAKEFLEIAKQELYKSAEQQVSISSTLYNLLALDEFKTIVNNFDTGNWIRIKIDGVLYKLRLSSYEINFDNIQTLNVEFTNATKNKNSINSMKEILKSTHSISSTYNSVSRQANFGGNANSTINDWINNSFNTAKIQIQNSENADFVFDKYGILGRMYDDTTGEYSNQQIRILFNNILYTNDNWNTISQAIGYNTFKTYEVDTDSWITQTGYGQVAQYVQAAQVTGSTIVGGIIYSDEFSDGTGVDENGNKNKAQGTKIDLKEGTFSFAGGKLNFNGKQLFIDSTSITDSLQSVGIIDKDLKVPASNIYGELMSTQIKSIDASQVTSGTFKTERIPNLNVSKITEGTFESRFIPDLNASKITSGTLATDRIPDLNASKITSGTLATDRIASTISKKKLDECEITNGTIEIGNFSVNDSGELSTSNGYIGNLKTRTITVYDSSNNTVSGLTGTYNFGNSSLTFIGGILISVS